MPHTADGRVGPMGVKPSSIRPDTGSVRTLRSMAFSPRRGGVLASVVAMCLLALPGPTAAVAAPAPAVVRTPGDASYELVMRSGAKGRIWRGGGSVTFTNLGAEPLPEVYVRTWSNGVLGCSPRSIVVSEVQGGTVTGEGLACTELEITLDQALEPSAAATISFDLQITLPEIDDRFGIHRGLALAGTALPILSVRDDAGWHRVPFEDLGESFYSVVSDYEVTLVTPEGLDTAATGIVTSRTETGRGRTRTTYAAQTVRDFAWAAGRFRTVTRNAGTTEVLVSYQPAAVRRAEARSAAADAVDVMRTLDGAFGAYPYPQVDVVLTGFGGFGGMEYPTIVFTEPSRIILSHELAHQWFYGTVGNDQYREPWLDESFATWAMRLPFDPRKGCAGISWPSAQAAFTNDMGYWTTHPGQYGLVYSGGACMLANLSRRFGPERFLRIIGRYAERHRFGVARTVDFMEAIETAAAKHLPQLDVAAFWDRWRVEQS